MITTILLLVSILWITAMMKCWRYNFLLAFATMITFVIWMLCCSYYAFTLASRTTFTEQLKNCDTHLKGQETVCKYYAIDKMNESLVQKKGLDYLLHWNLLEIK